MRRNVILAVSAAAIGVVALTSCKGRYADGTPNGETVDVVLEATVAPADTLTVVDEEASEADPAPAVEADEVGQSQTESDKV